MQKRNRAIENPPELHSIFVDSSAWIALFSRRDQHHGEADRIFRTIIAQKRRMVTTNLILAEIHRLLLHRAGVGAAVAAIKRIEASSRVTIEFADSSPHKTAFRWIEKLQDLPVSYTDAVSFSVMEATGCREALSYDHHFRSAGFIIP